MTLKATSGALQSKIANNPLTINHLFMKKTILKLDYYQELESKLDENTINSIPYRYTYLWIKAAQCLGLGFDIYRKRDANHFPLKEWESSALLSGIEQIVHQLGGISPSHSIEQTSINDIEHLLMTFHFELKNFEKISSDGLLKVCCKHIILAEQLNSDYQFFLYFKLTQK
jgi:hypothetical protein